ncbi:MAG: FecR domain-containing protein, partial [Planctomycetota bacterium]|nr:FecR domain-containing protein [Planctomycetota bacterium]
MSDDDRELWLSRYLDGELDEPAREAVAEKLRTDEQWRTEFAEMQRADRMAAAAARRYRADDGFSANVVRKLKGREPVAVRSATPPHMHRPVRRARRSVLRWPLRIAALIALGLGAWQTYVGKPVDNRSTARTAAPQDQSVAAVAAITVTEDQRAIAWPDGTQILARKGTVLQALDSRTLKLDGAAFFKVARNEAVPFTIRSSAGHVVQALGTCFDLTTSAEGAHVRVAEGHVRVQSAAGKTADAFAGMEVLVDLRVQAFDVRELSAAWRCPDAEDLAAPWPQLGGSPGHSGMTPFAGPANLVARPQLFFQVAGENDRVPLSGAVISSNCAYVLVGRDTPDELRRIVIAGPAQGRQHRIAVNGGLAPVSPVISSAGAVVIVGQDGMVVTACDAGGSDEERRPAWSYKATSPVTGLCVSSDGAVLLSTAA